MRSAEPSSAKKDYKMYREPSDKDSVGIGMIARNGGLPPKGRMSYQPKTEAQTPAMPPNKASDLHSLMNDKLSLPRI